MIRQYNAFNMNQKAITLLAAALIPLAALAQENEKKIYMASKF